MEDKKPLTINELKKQLNITPERQAEIDRFEEEYKNQLETPEFQNWLKQQLLGFKPGDVPDRATTDEKKEEVIKRLLELWKKNPYLRLGQLICNVVENPYHTEDFTLIERLEEFYKNEH